MTHLLQVVPAAVLATLLLFVGSLLTGWLGSIIAGFRAPQGKGLRLLLVFPVTSPVALLILWFRHCRAAFIPMICYGIALLSLPAGGFLSERIERSRLERLVRSLEQAGESVAVASLNSEPVPMEENVWSHPFLELLARAGQHGPEGERARAEMDERYRAMSVPQRPSGVRYLDEATGGRESRDKPYWNPFRTFHEIALSTDAGQELLKSDRSPTSWEECGALLLEHFQPAEQDFAALEEALSRPRGRYPNDWERGFSLLLPHLAKLKSFTQCTTWRSIAWNSRGDPEAAYRDLRAALRLLEIGDSDLLISRLVQWAQCAITLQAVMTAQQYHAWNEKQWAAVQVELGALDFPGQVPDSMRAERVLGHVTISPMLRQSPFEMQQSWNQLGTAPQEYDLEDFGARRGVRILVNVSIGGLARAFLASQWRLALEAYQEFIVAIEAAVRESRSEAWSGLHVAELSRPIEQYGVFAEMLMPSLDKAFKKSIEIQTQVRLAAVACALERYFLSHDRYPDSVSELSPDYLAGPVWDPMTREVWRYERKGDRSFRLYSVGRNGIDEGGFYTSGALPANEPRKDDRAWVITEPLPPLPEVVVDLPAQREDGIQPEMMRRYGLVPSEPALAPPGTNSSSKE